MFCCALPLERQCAERDYRFSTQGRVNFFVVAGNAKSAKKKTFQMEEFKNKKMHIDGIKEISSVDGYEVSHVKNYKHKKSRTFTYDESKKL